MKFYWVAAFTFNFIYVRVFAWMLTFKEFYYDLLYRTWYPLIKNKI